MSKTLKLAALYPDHLNLNGDMANLLVLQKRLQWQGEAAEIVSLTSSSNLSDVDFVLAGHGSNAAWADIKRIDPDFLKNVLKFIESGKSALVIASAYDQLAEGVLGGKKRIGSHRSEFVRTAEGIVGYVNTDSNEEVLQWHKNSLFTLLHGPVFVKNPELADEFILKSGLVKEIQPNNRSIEIDELARASRKIAFEN